MKLPLSSLTLLVTHEVLPVQGAYLSLGVQTLYWGLITYTWLVYWLPMWLNSVFRSIDTAWHKEHILSDIAGLCGMASPYSRVLRFVISYLYFWKKLDADKILLANTMFHNRSIQLCPMSSRIICVVSIWRWRQNTAERILNILIKSMKALKLKDTYTLEEKLWPT